MKATHPAAATKAKNEERREERKERRGAKD